MRERKGAGKERKVEGRRGREINKGGTSRMFWSLARLFRRKKRRCGIRPLEADPFGRFPKAPCSRMR